MTRGGAARLGRAAAVSLGCAAVLLVHLGYEFERSDQLQYLLLPYRRLIADFAVGDWFTWQTSHYHVTFGWLVRGLHALAGEDGFPTAMFLAHLGVLVWLGYAIFRLSSSWGAGRFGAWLAVLVFAMIREKGIGGATISHGHLLPSDLALPPLLLALSAWMGGRRRLAGLHLGVSGLLHANFAVLGPLVVAIAEVPRLWRERRRPVVALRPVVEMAAVFLVVASPTLWMVAQAFTTADASPQAVNIIFELRSPHHYSLSAMSPASLWWPLLLACWGLPAWRDTFADTNARPRQLIALALLAVLLIGLVGSLLSIGAIVRLFTWRLSSPFLCILLLQVARTGYAALADRNALGIALWLTGLLCASTFARSDLPEVASGGIPTEWFALPVVALLALASSRPLSSPHAVGPTDATAAAATADPIRAIRMVAMALCLLWAGHAWAHSPVKHMRAGTLRGPKVSGPRVSRIVLTGAAHSSSLRDMHRYARTQTPVGSRFLVPPHMIKFRVATQRAVFVDFKAAPMRGDEALEWLRRMHAAAGVERFETRGYALRYEAGRLYNKRPLGELAALARREGLDYLIARKVKKPGRMGLRRVFVDKERSALYRRPTTWVLYEVLDG